MNLAWVRDPEAVLDRAEICGIQAGVLKVQCLLEITQGIPKLCLLYTSDAADE